MRTLLAFDGDRDHGETRHGYHSWMDKGIIRVRQSKGWKVELARAL